MADLDLRVTSPVVSITDSTSNVTKGVAGKQGETLVGEIHGRSFVAANRGIVFRAIASAVTIPAVASSLVSTFTIINPIGSGVNLELLDVDIGLTSATTVVDTLAFYYQNLNLGNAYPTNLTGGTPIAMPLGSQKVGNAKFYTSASLVGALATIAPLDIITTLLAVTSTSTTPMRKDYNGQIVVGPGTLLVIAGSTAAETAGAYVSATWAEWPTP